MKITDIYTVSIAGPEPTGDTDPRRESWLSDARVATPMSGYPRYAADRTSWSPTFDRFGCVVEAEDGTKGFAIGDHGKPVATLVDDYLGPRLVDENAMAIEKIHDMAVRMCTPFGTTGLASYAVSAIDLALWDLKGKLLDVPVYELLGGPMRAELPCYATGNDVDWYVELGFSAVKLACPYGPSDGIDGIRKNAELVSEARSIVGADGEVMLDCWMAFDEEYTVRLANELRQYDLGWIEEPLPPENPDAHSAVRTRLPWQTLATGEHWYSIESFQHAANNRVVDVLQPDIRWVGGLTPLRKIAGIAEAAGLSLVPHGGGNTAYGQHACFGLSNIPRAECFIGTPPGVPLEEGPWNLGQSIPENGTLTPPDGPGFGVDPDRLELERPFTE